MNAIEKGPWDKQGPVCSGGTTRESRKSRNSLRHSQRKGNIVEDLVATIMAEDIPYLLKTSTDPAATLVRLALHLSKDQINDASTAGNEYILSATSELAGWIKNTYEVDVSNPPRKEDYFTFIGWNQDLGAAWYDAIKRKLAWFGGHDELVEWIEYVVSMYAYAKNPVQLERSA